MLSAKFLAKINEEQINQISSVATARALLKERNINLKGLRSLHDMKTRLLLHIKNSTRSESMNNVQHVLQEDRAVLNKLANIQDQASKIFVKLNASAVRFVAAYTDDNWQQEFKENCMKLRNKESTILVAGETSSGKSSLINLLIGEELLPTSVTSSTACITVIRYGREKKFVVHRDTPDQSTGQKINEYQFDNSNYTEQLSKYIHDLERHTVWPYKLVEVYWPIDFLKNGTFIVDSPGIGESENMTARVHEYFKNAFAFIYVINSGNAGGIQKDRLQKLLQETIRLHHSQIRSFDPTIAIFVCNKWDKIPSDEAKIVADNTYAKLSTIWPGCQKEQIFYISTLKSLTHSNNGGYVTDDFRHLLTGINQLIPISSKRMIQTYWSKLYFIFGKLVCCYRYQINSLIRKQEEHEHTVARLRKDVEAIRHELKDDHIKNELFSHMNIEIRNISKKLYEYLQSDYSRDVLYRWDVDSLPNQDDNFKATVQMLQEEIEIKITQHIYDWEKQHGEFKKLQSTLYQQFERNFGCVREQLKQIEQDMQVEQYVQHEFINDSSQPIDFEFGLGQKITLGFAAPLLIPIGLAATIIGGVIVALFGTAIGVKKAVDAIALRNEKKKYKNDPLAYIQNLMKNAMNNLTREQIMEIFAKNIVSIKRDLTNLFDRLPVICSAYESLFNEEVDKSIRKQNFFVEIREQLKEISSMYDKLAEFQLTHLEKYDYDESSIIDYNRAFNVDRLEEKDTSIVIKRQLQVPNSHHTIYVALKMFKTVNTSLHGIIQEIRTLRNFQHKNIIKFYGTVCLSTEEYNTVGLALELGLYSLYQYLSNKPNLVPGSFPNNPITCQQAFNAATLPFSYQIADAVNYLHQRKNIYRDLKMDNILIGNDKCIRLRDLGTARNSKRVSTFTSETLLYVAPEILEGKQHDTRADIFCMATIFWEMWYGINLSTDATIARKYVQNDSKANLLPLNKVPALYEPFAALIARCWSKNPRKRPTAEECCLELSQMHWE